MSGTGAGELASDRGRASDLAAGFAVLLCLAPLLLRYAPPIQASWDEAYFLGRAACLSRTVATLDGEGFAGCLSEAKRPLLVSLAAIPFGALASTPSGLGLVPISFAVLEWVLAIAIVALLLALRVPRWLMIAVAAALAPTPLVRDQSGRLLADVPFALTVALAVLLVPLETRAGSPATRRADAARGLLWGAVLGAGLLGKLTCVVFGAIVGPTLIALRWRARGLRSAATALAFAALAAAPAIAITAYRWPLLYAHARNATVGPWAHRFASGHTPWTLLRAVDASARNVTFTCLLLAAAIPLAIRLGRRCAVLTCLPGVVAIGVYEAAILLSVNQDFRFQFPTLIALPVALLVPWARLDGGAGGSPVPARHVVAWLAAGLLLAMPMSARYDLGNVVDLARVLGALPSSRPLRVVLVTDSPTLSTDTLSAARELVPSGPRRLRIDTVSFDEPDGHDVAFSLAKIEAADYVVLEPELSTSAPAWTNVRAARCRELAALRGRRLPELSSRALEVYELRPR
jgi:hypothetical protein